MCWWMMGENPSVIESDSSSEREVRLAASS